MNEMPNFTPIRLPYGADDTSYRQAIDAVRKWAGPDIHFGDAEPLESEREGGLTLSERLCDRTMALGISSSELAGSEMTYTATIPKGVASTGSLKVVICADEAGEAWITSISVVSPVPEITPNDESEVPAHIQIARSKWNFTFPHKAHTLVVAMLLKQQGVEQDTDTDKLIDLIEAEVKQAKAKPLRVSRV